MSAFPGWPEPHYVETNGIRMAVFEAGPKSAKPPIVFCHGFPELAFSWRHQVRDLAAQGFRTIAPDQRGYGRTPYVGPVEDFDMEHLVGDLIGMADALGVEKAVWCGHDWGGIVTWQIPLRHPERVAGMIGVNTPFMRRNKFDPIAGMRARFGDEMYIVYFQMPKEPDAILDADPDKSIRYFMRKSGAFTTEAADAPREARSLALIHAIAKYDPATCKQQFLTDQERDYFVNAFRNTGFTGGINWYRNFTRNWERSEGIKELVEAPSLMIMAEHDVVLSPAMAEGMEANVPNLTKHLVRNCGHWTQQEKADEVTQVIADWMRKTFP